MGNQKERSAIHGGDNCLKVVGPTANGLEQIQSNAFIDNIKNVAVEVTKRGNNWFSFKEARFVEDYLEGLRELHLHYAIPALGKDFGGTAGNLQEFCATFRQRGFSGVASGGNDGDFGINAQTANNDGAMFINNVQAVQIPKDLIPAFVRIQPLYVSDCIGGRPYYSFVDFGVKESLLQLPVVDEGKLGLVSDGGNPTKLNNHVANHDVQRGAKVVNGIADNKPPLKVGHFINPQALLVLTSHLVNLGKGGLSVSVVALDEGVKLTEMLFGPLDFQPSAL